MRAGIAPLLRLYILFLYVYRRSPRQWPASETLLSFRAAGRTLRCRRRAWDSAPTSAPESLALLHARNRFLWRHSCLLPDRTTSSRTRRSFRSCRTRWRPSSFGIISHRVNAGRLLATCQVPWARRRRPTVHYFQNNISWSWPRRHRAAAVTVVSSCLGRSWRRAPALQPQSACIICLHHAAPRHADAEGLAPCEKRWRIKVAKERAKAGLGNIWDLALRSCRWTPQCLGRQSTAARHLRTKPLELERSRPQIAIAWIMTVLALCFFERQIFLLPWGRHRPCQAAVGPCLRLYRLPFLLFFCFV